MRKIQFLAFALSLLVGFILASGLNRTSSGQPADSRPWPDGAAVGRYQLTAPIQGEFSDSLILTDTATGHCWVHNRNDKEDHWSDLGTPAKQK
jgi:hypothetical protein